MKKNSFFSFLIAFFAAVGAWAQSVTLTLPDMTVEPGETFNVDIKASDFDNIASMQFAVLWNPAIIEFKGLENLNPDMPEFYNDIVNFNTTKAGQGLIRVLWYWFDPSTNAGVTLDDNSVIFSIKFKAVGSEGSQTEVQVAPDTTSVPTFDVEFGNFNQQIGVNIENSLVTIDGTSATKESITEDFILFQNSPNPFTEITYISFRLNAAEEGNLTIFDQSGKVVYEESRKYPAGLSRIPVRRDMLSAAGTYFYALKTERASATRQLVMQ
jgi:hypothetical protein